MTRKKQRVHTVRPSKEFAEASLNPMHDKDNENEKEKNEEKNGDPASWEDMAKKFEELESRLAEQFENNGGDDREAPPIIKAPEKPTQEEWARHQTTHTHTHHTHHGVHTVWRQGMQGDNTHLVEGKQR